MRDRTPMKKPGRAATGSSGPDAPAPAAHVRCRCKRIPRGAKGCPRRHGRSSWVAHVLPLIYIYEGGDRLYLHTGNHRGHFVRNIDHDPRVCVEVAEMGPVHRGQPFACNSALVFTSVIAFGSVRMLDDRATKTWFFDQILASTVSPIGPSAPDIRCLTVSSCTSSRLRS